jgi:peptidoglycan/xylan/chitin deacetylase (PgdA/CDA1 family)
MKFIPLPCLLAAILFASCSTNPEVKASKPSTNTISLPPKPAETSVDTVMADAPTIIERKQVPILCYHDIKEWRPNEKLSMKVYLVPVQRFKDQIKLLADSGYHSITPDQYYNYLAHSTPLPEKPVMFTFDDTDAEQYTIGAAELNKFGFKGVFFIMTISIGRPNYMSKEQIKALSDSGHIIASHTWDHHDVRHYKEEDWEKQLVEPKQKLEEITGKPVEYFAYPFGAWNKEAIPHIKKAGYKAAFQLTAKRDPADPLFTIRRMLASGTYDAPALQKWMRANF